MAGTQDTEGRRLAPPVLHLLRRTSRYWRLALWVAAAGMTVAAIVVHNTKQVYRSESVILYRQAARQAYGEQDSSRRVGARLQDMVVARDRLATIVRDLNLFPEIANPDERIDELKKRVGFRVRDGSTFVLSYDGDTPEGAQAVTARLAQGLLSADGLQRTQLAEATRKLLEEERKRFAEEVAQKEQAMASFLREHPQLVLDRAELAATPTPAAPPVPGAAPLEAELSRLRERQRAIGAPPSPVVDVSETVALRKRAEADLAQAQRDLSAVEARFTDAHPDVLTARARVRLAQATMERLATAAEAPPQVSAGASPEEVELATQIAAVQKKLSRLRRENRAANPLGPKVDPKMAEAEVQLQSLRYELGQARERLSGLEDKQFQAALLAKLESNGDVGQLVVLDAAYRPGLPFVDKKKKVGMLLLGLTFMLAIGAALLRALTDDRLFDRDDVEWMTSRQVLAVIPSGVRARRHQRG